jgi:hypothetical protein
MNISMLNCREIRDRQFIGQKALMTNKGLPLPNKIHPAYKN